MGKRAQLPIFRWMHIKDTPKSAIWVSKLDGSRFHEVGNITPDVKGTEPDSSLKEIDHLKWLPSGQKVSFLYDGVLYTVPVD